MSQRDVLGPSWSVSRDRGRHRRAAISSARTVVPRIASIVMGVVLAVIVGVQSVGGSSRDLLLIVVGISAATVLLILAYTRFAAFVIGIIVIRASVDWTKAPTQLGEPTRSGVMTTGLAVLFIVAAVAWLLVQYRAGRLVRPALLSIAWVVFLVASVVSAVTSHRPLDSLAEAGRIAAAVAMLVILDQLLRSGTYIRPILAACYASALVPIAVAAHQALTTGVATATDGTGRVYGTFAHPNALGFYLTILIVMGVALLPHLAGSVRPLLLLFVSSAAVMVVLTYSRGSWVALLIGLVAVSLLQAPRLVLLILGIAVVVALTVPSVTARVLDLRPEQNVAGVEGDSLQWRFTYWRTIAGLADDRPLFGIGPKMTQYVTDQAKVPHNDFLRAYVETGLVGLCAYAAVVLALIHTARSALARSAPGFERGVAVGFVGCVASFIVFSVAENLISQVVVLWYFVAFAAAAISVTHPSARSQALPTPS
jgi:O-antigen ligase